jgi:UDP-GlcNAc3NAcA epimerase
MKKIIAIVGARPQFIKHASFEIVARDKFDLITIHTGQHYDENMSSVFFDELKISAPKYKLNLGGASHGVQTGGMLIEIENILDQETPDAVVVYGDTNSTLAGALAASKLGITLIHIEAGLRSYNKEMPEEINRILTDHVSNLLFVPSKQAIANLKKENITENVFLVGDIMKDLVIKLSKSTLLSNPIYKGNYYYATIHRPYNTDEPNRLRFILENLNTLGEKVVFSLHPRTKNLINQFSIDLTDFENLVFIPPQGYTENLSLLIHANGLITDSGGMQKEAYWLKKKCVTIRKETEWIETLLNDNNSLLFQNLNSLKSILLEPIKHWDAKLYGTGESTKKMVESIRDNI